MIEMVFKKSLSFYTWLCYIAQAGLELSLSNKLVLSFQFVRFSCPSVGIIGVCYHDWLKVSNFKVLSTK